MLSTDAQERKDIPVYSGLFCYFPDAIAEVARLSKAGNDQHNPGSDLHWDRSKSGDELDALARHLLDNASAGDDIEHLRAVAWRAMAQLQKACEKRDAVVMIIFDEASDWLPVESSKSQKNAPPNESYYERLLRVGRLNEYKRGDVHEQMRESRLKDD